MVNILFLKLFSLCGGTNIFADLKVLAPQVSFEAVIQANPDLIITGEQSIHELETWKKWQTIEAVKNNNYLGINSDHLVRAGPRILQGAENHLLKNKFHEEHSQITLTHYHSIPF